jgi:predicted metal-dependent hydrolase
MTELIIEDWSIEVEKKRIKNLHLRIYGSNGRIKVSAPLKMDLESIKNFVLSKREWIKKHCPKIQNQHLTITKQYISGEFHPFQGEEYKLLILSTDKKNHVLLKDGTIQVFISKSSVNHNIEVLLEQWYRTQMKAEIPKLIQKWETIIMVSSNDFGIKKMRTKWGTCNTVTKKIWLSLELIKKYPECLEYVVVHELIHLKERNHNAKFYAYMDLYLPNWKSIHLKLNKYSVD